MAELPVEQTTSDQAKRLRQQVTELQAEVERLRRQRAVITADMRGDAAERNSGAERLLGWGEAATLDHPCKLIFTSGDCAAGVPEAQMRRALDEGRAVHGHWHVRRDGTGQQREARERQMLLAELSHRARNTLAIVQSLLSQTARGAATPAALQEALEGRLNALAIAHDLLTREAWAGAGLADVVQATLAPFIASASRMRTHGPNLRLTPNAVLVLNMALNELATNAVRFGALSNKQGSLEVMWSLDRPPEASGGCTLDVLWRERGGPPVVAPAPRGFGSRLIEDSVSYQLGGNVSLRFLPEGVECRFQIPLVNHVGERIDR